MTNKNPNREAAHNERKPASDQPTAQRKPSEAPGLITRSADSAEPSRRAAPERRTARQGRPSGRAPGTTIGGCHACAAVGRATQPRNKKGRDAEGFPRRPFGTQCEHAASQGCATACDADGPAAGAAGSDRCLKTQKARRGNIPLRASPGASGAPARISSRAEARKHRKAPSASATPCPPAALRCSTLGEGGLNCRVRDGTG